jgi:hypothetical protein
MKSKDLRLKGIGTGDKGLRKTPPPFRATPASGDKKGSISYYFRGEFSYFVLPDVKSREPQSKLWKQISQQTTGY